MPDKVTITTADGVRIAGDFYGREDDRRGLLLLHMMPATKESWRDLAGKLAGLGFAVLAIDLRGHGMSVEGPKGRLDYKLFEDREHQAKRLDVEAAADWLTAALGIGREQLGIAGASIGANLAIAYGAEHPEVRAVAALSPGRDYRGVTTPDKVRRFGAGQSLFLAASSEDQLSFETDRELAKIKPDAELREYQNAGHGTSMFARQPELLDELARWFDSKISLAP